MRRQPDPATIGGRLKVERERLGMSQTAFAALAGATKSAQLKWECGGSFPTANILESFGKAGADVAFIITGERRLPPATVAARDALAALPPADRRALLLDLLAEELAG